MFNDNFTNEIKEFSTALCFGTALLLIIACSPSFVSFISIDSYLSIARVAR